MFARGRCSPTGLLTGSICLRCLAQSSKSKPNVTRKLFSSSSQGIEQTVPKFPRRFIFRREYFSANDSIGKIIPQAFKSSLGSLNTSRPEEPQLRTFVADQTQRKQSNPSSIDAYPESRIPTEPFESEEQKFAPDAEPTIPLDASSRLSTISMTLPRSSPRRLVMTYLSLAKPRLSFLVVLTTAATYSIFPVPAVLLPSTTVAPSLSALTLLFLTSGTALCAASANALNMLMEPQHDAKMSRTRNRPLVRGLIGQRGALLFAGIAGIVGVGGLYYGVNPTVAFLGGLNILLYAGVYTPMKRISVLNTWVGAIVGGIPPLMGWAAAAGQSATGTGGWQELLWGEENIGGWLLAALLFAWQFPHFNSFSWTVREEYKSAGYRMLAWTNSKMNSRIALRYSLLFFPLCAALTWYGVTDHGFLVTSSVVNLWLVRGAWVFWNNQGLKGSARGLFWASVWHLPILMVLAMAQKKGLWEGVWKRVTGETDNEGEYYLVEEQDEGHVTEETLQPTQPQPLSLRKLLPVA